MNKPVNVTLSLNTRLNPESGEARSRRSARTWAVAEVLFPLQERLKRHTSRSVRQHLERTQWWSHQDIQRLQVARLKALLQEAQANVPYYRGLFARLGFDAQAMEGLSDLARLPFLDKPTIRANVEELKNEKAKGLSRFNTGGSSGEPLIFFIGRERMSHDVAAKWRATRWWNVDIGDPEMVVWGSPIELGAQDHVRRVRDALMRTELLPAFEMNDRRLDEFIKRIRSRRPLMLFGYPSSLSLIASHARTRGMALDNLGIRVVFVTSERLYDEQRKVMEETFGCPVANGYGGRDAGFIAHQCPHGSLHITAEDIIVETIGEDGNPVTPGKAGEIVVTHLATRDFPFIRYRTGDVGVLGTKPCSCGRGLPVLEEIQGRSTDFVVASDGTVMHGLALIYILRDLPGIQSFKVTQRTMDLTEVDIVPGPSFSPYVVPRVVDGFKQRLGADVDVRVSLVQAIAAERSGKFRYIVSHVKSGPVSFSTVQP